MKKIIFALLLLVNVSAASAQEAKNVADLDFVYQAIKKMPSFEDQLRNDKNYIALYQKLRANLTDTNELAVYKKLYQLIAPIKDNHLGFYKEVDTTVKSRPILLKINTDSLRQELLKSPLNDLEGIYKVDEHEFAVFKSAASEYSILYLKTKIVTGFLVETPHQSLDFISLTGGNRGMVLARNVKHVNGNFTTINLYKTAKPKFGNLVIGKSNFEFKKLSNEVDYLRLSSFSSTNTNIAASIAFLNSVKDSINAPNIIVDVRNNTGGGFKTSKRFIDFLTKFKGKIFMLQNVKTGSNAEKFIIRLKDNKNVVTLGETTVGTLAYGSNYGKTLTLPYHKFEFYPTDMKADRLDLAYESIGVKPMVALDYFSEDWISQTLRYIETYKDK